MLDKGAVQEKGAVLVESNVSQCQHAFGAFGPGRISCLRQYSRPRPRTVRVHAKICVWLESKRQSAGDLRSRVLRITISIKNGAKRGRMEQKWHQQRPKWTKSDQNGAKSEPKGSQRVTKMHIKIDLRRRSPKVSIFTDSRDAFWSHFGSIFH